MAAKELHGYGWQTQPVTPNGDSPWDDTNDALKVVTVAGASGLVPMDDLAKVQATNSTDGSFPATAPTTTQPALTATRAVLTMTGRENLLLVFFGTGNDNDTFDYRVVGWQKISTLWVPIAIAQGSVTLSTVVGVAAAAVLNTERFGDTIDVDAGIGVVSNAPVANACAASVEVPVGPYDLVEVLFDLTGATAANALYSTY